MGQKILFEVLRSREFIEDHHVSTSLDLPPVAFRLRFVTARDQHKREGATDGNDRRNF